MKMTKRKRSKDPRRLSEIQQSADERLQLQRAVEEAEQEIAEGKWVEHSEILEKLSRWSTGKT
jgi:predicted transcriptional regulator